MFYLWVFIGGFIMIECYIRDLLRFIPHESKEGLTEVQTLVVMAIKQINNNNRFATYNKIYRVIQLIDYEMLGKSTETYSRAIRKLVELGIIKKLRNGCFYHDKTLLGNRIKEQKTFHINKRSYSYRGRRK